MSCCINCGSYAINQSQHGREFGVDTNLCDVCYWRKRAENTGSVSDYECRKLLYGFMLDCNAVGLDQAAKNLHKGMKQITMRLGKTK